MHDKGGRGEQLPYRNGRRGQGHGLILGRPDEMADGGIHFWADKLTLYGFSHVRHGSFDAPEQASPLNAE
jgi:hypothetical protein